MAIEGVSITSTEITLVVYGFDVEAKAARVSAEVLSPRGIRVSSKVSKFLDNSHTTLT